jgi:hypothetical protein
LISSFSVIGFGELISLSVLISLFSIGCSSFSLWFSFFEEFLERGNSILSFGLIEVFFSLYF